MQKTIFSKLICCILFSECCFDLLLFDLKKDKGHSRSRKKKNFKFSLRNSAEITRTLQIGTAETSTHSNWYATVLFNIKENSNVKLRPTNIKLLNILV